MKFKLFIALIGILISLVQCKSQKKETLAIIETDMGTITVKLYDETPRHKENFIKLIKSGFYKDRIFHRIIKDFMIQGGDPQYPANAKYKDSLNYTLPAEINPKFYHKKGALAAARLGDEINPNQESSPTQFYIVQGKSLSASDLQQMENSVNQSLINKYFISSYRELSKDTTLTQEQIRNMAEKKALEQIYLTPFRYTNEQKEVYTTLGGTPHLDMNYTVFGEVVSGMEIVDKIAAQATSERDKPVKDIKFSIRLK